MGILLITLWFWAQRPITPEILFQPIPDWVHLQPFDPSANPAHNKRWGGQIDLLTERQEHIGQRASFFRSAYRIENAVGLQNGAQIAIEFDPIHQALIVHKLVLHRNGEILKAIPDDGWKLLQQENELDRYLYNGRFSAIAFLEDLRVGDTVEYAISLIQKKTLFGEKYWLRLATNFVRSVNTIHYRVIAPQSMALQIHAEDETFKPSIEVIEGLREYRWLAGVDGAQPIAMYDPEKNEQRQLLTISAYQNWGEIQHQIEPLFRLEANSPWLDDWLAGVQQTYANQEDQVRAAIRFVQDEIRYLGIEIGASSFVPSPPKETFRRRFGDCKDKSQLLCVMLRRLGLPATSVLVQTENGDKLDMGLPSPFVFNHVVLVFDWKGEQVGIDATASHERGRLADRAGLPFGKGLILNGYDRELVDLPYRSARIRVDIRYELDAPGWGDDAHLQVVTTFQGVQADIERERLDKQSRSVTSAWLKQRLEGVFPSLELNEMIRVEDDPETNTLIRIESYHIPGFGLEEEDRSFMVSAYPMLEYLGWPDAKGPDWRPEYLAEIHMSYQLRLPEKWPFNGEKKRIRNEIFEFDYQSSRSGKSYQFQWAFKSKKGGGATVSSKHYKEDLALFHASLNPFISRWGGARLRFVDVFWSANFLRWDSLFSMVVFGWALFIMMRIRRGYRRREWAHWFEGKGRPKS